MGMAIYDREYYSEEQSNWSGGPLWNQRMVVTNLVLLNVAFFLVNFLLGGRENVITTAMELKGENLTQPWFWWHLLTYAFAHAPDNPWHLFWNMFGLWMLGRTVEMHYGRNEFLRIYLAAAIFGGLVFMFRAFLTNSTIPVIGASGAVICIEMLFVLLNPKATLMLYGVLPLPAWVFGAFLIGANLLGGDKDTAYDVHIAGLVFAFAYFLLQWNLGNWFGSWNWANLKRKWSGPRLRVHRPDSIVADEQEADRILQKIFEKGQDSLTTKERRFMEKYSLRKRQQQQDK
jgi:membrane associated rhomboid family serine protease